jgi:hypothetical protein
VSIRQEPLQGIRGAIRINPRAVRIRKRVRYVRGVGPAPTAPVRRSASASSAGAAPSGGARPGRRRRTRRHRRGSR